MMGTTTPATRASGAQALRNNAQTAQICALGSNGKCSFCQRTGLPILPLRYAVIPNMIAGRRDDVLSQHATLGEGVAPKTLKGHHYTVRALRAGFVHVYLGQAGRWQVYASTADGLLRLLANPDDPDQKTARDMTPQCKSDAHNIPASFINIPAAYQSRTIWIAFARDAWSATTRANYERAPGKRMQSFNCAALAAAPDTLPHAFEVPQDGAKLNRLVDEYAADAAQATARRRYEWAEVVDANRNGSLDEGRGAWPSIHSFVPRTGQHLFVGKFAADYKKATTKTVSAIVLHDAVGMVEEINHLRLQVVEWRAKYASNSTVARARLVSQAIQGTRKIYENLALNKTLAEKGMVIVDEVSATAQAANPGKTLVAADKAEQVAKATPYVYYPPPPPTLAGISVMPQSIRTNVWDWSVGQAHGDWRKMESHYREGDRAAFDISHKKEMETFQRWLEEYGADYAAWAGDPAWKLWLDDYVKTDGEEVANSIKLAGSCLSGGPTDAASHALWKKWLESKPNDPTNPVYIAMFGPAKNIVDYLTPDGLPFDAAPDKSDKLYDTVKGWVASRQGDDFIRRAAADAGLTAAVSHIEMAVASAVATLGDGLSAQGQAVALRAQQAVLHAYKRTQAVFIKLAMTVGQYVDALKAAGMDAARAAKQALSKVLEDVTTRGGRKVRALMLAGMLRINDPRVRNIVIEVRLWTLEGVASLRNAINSAKAEAIKAVRGLSIDAIALIGRMQVAGITLSREAGTAARELVAGVRLSASQTASLARKMMSGAVRVAGAKAELMLAAGSILFQSWSLMDSMREMRKKVGADKREAWLSVISASVGIAAGVAEAAGLALRALALTGWKLALKIGGVLAAVASAVDCVQAWSAAWRTGSQGDRDAAVWYGLAGTAFFGAAIAGAFVVGAAATSGFAALTLAGPLGWAILLVVVGVGLLFAAMWAEDTPLEIWLDRCFFGNGKRSEGRWTDARHGEEVAELNSVILGAKAEIGFNDDWNELITGTDTVNLRFTLPQFDASGSAYSISAFAITAGGSMMPIFGRQWNRASGIVFEPLVPGRYKVLPGSEKVTTVDGARVVSVDVEVNRSAYRKVQAKLQYWPDADDETAILEIDKIVTD
jgi:hypothetical protein